MEFSSRGFQRESARPAAPGSPAGSISPDNKKGLNKKRLGNINKTSPAFILGIILSISLLILVIALLFGISFKSSEASLVDKNRYQAVFLNGGQAYFGKIKSLNERYIDISDIYYISTNGQSGNNQQANISLVKLGSELHCPQDRMIVNRDQVLFWENLNDDGKVVNAIKQWQKENPNGQKCNNQTTQQQTPASTENDGQSSDSTTGQNNPSSNPTANGSNSNSTNNNTNSSANNPTNTGNTTTNPNTPTSNSPTTP